MVGLVGVEARVQVRARAGRERVKSEAPEKLRALFKRCSRERFATGALFSTVQLGPAHGRLVESDCPYGAEPRPCPGLLGWNLRSVISLHFWER